MIIYYRFSFFYNQVADYKSGKTKVFNFLIGQVQRELEGRANAKVVAQILQTIVTAKWKI